MMSTFISVSGATLLVSSAERLIGSARHRDRPLA